MLEFQNVVFQYDSEDFNIIDGLSFHIAPGEFVSVVGPSGCGKSTIFRLTNQLLSKKSGEILVGGEKIDGRRGYCGYMPQRDLLFPWRSVRDNLCLPMEIRGGISRAEMAQRADETLAHVGLSGWGDKRPDELSGGMRQRAAFARTLLTGSDLLLLDEPFSALDFLTRINMQEWLLDQWESDHKTVLFITHDVEEAIFLSSRVLVVEETPIRRLVSFEVPATYPRTRACLTEPKMLALREQLIDLLRREVSALVKTPICPHCCFCLRCLSCGRRAQWAWMRLTFCRRRRRFWCVCGSCAAHC